MDRVRNRNQEGCPWPSGKGPRLPTTQPITAWIRVETCGASVVQPMHANIAIIVCVRSSATSKSWKSPYDPEGVGVTEKPQIIIK